MFFDGRKLPDEKVFRTDVCIVGGGASGITLALEFINAPIDVLLIESGGHKFDHRSQLLYQARNIGRPYYDMEFTKQRYFGGASNKWFGRSRPLDEIDFENRPWVKYSGWPFSRKELDPFYQRASSVCQLDVYDYEPISWEADGREQLKFLDSDLETKTFQFSPPTRFGQIYFEPIKNAKNIKSFLYSNATSISLNAQGTKVERVNFATLKGNRFQVKAKHFILAASALENTRLLLISNDVQTNGIGNQHDLVGRFFMEHPHIFECVLITPLTPKQVRYYKILNYDTVSTNLGNAGALGLKEKTIRREQILNASAFFVQRKRYKVDDCYFSRGGLALAKVMDTLQHRNAPGLQFLGYIGNAIKETKTIASIVGLWFKGIANSNTYVTLRSQLETVPNPESRVILSDVKDRLGLPKLALNWQLTQQDLESYLRYRSLLFKSLKKAEIKLRILNHETDETGWPVTMMAAKHHMGTTRMHSNPKLGVVDSDCKVHGISNLFIAGSSVFPTSGQANPMLTIVALSIRLADHIKLLLVNRTNIELP